MKALVAHGAEVVDPSILGKEAKLKFIVDLYDLHQKIFIGVSRDIFRSYVVDSPAQWSRIQIFRSEQGEAVGYCAIHRFHLYLDQRELIVFRAEAGVLRAYRGRSMTLWFGFSEAIKYHLCHPLKTCFYMGSFVHPSVLFMFSRYMKVFYPQANRKIPRHIKQLMLYLADEFHLQPVAGQHELVRDVGWITRESPKDRDFWLRHPNPEVRLYIETNPGYINGSGLLTLMPLTFLNMIWSLMRFARIKLFKKLRRLFA